MKFVLLMVVIHFVMSFLTTFLMRRSWRRRNIPTHNAAIMGRVWPITFPMLIWELLFPIDYRRW